MKDRSRFLLAAAAFLGAAALAFFVSTRTPEPGKTRSAGALAEAEAAFRSGRPDEAERGFREFVEKNAKNPDAARQDQVTRARMHLGYLAARQNRYEEARKTFVEAEKRHRGTGAVDPAFGSAPDQAAYQAAVCLAAEGKASEALAAFRDFIKQRPLSPLVSAAHRRIGMLEGGRTTPDDDMLLQVALDKQTRVAAKEMAVCGPKALSAMLERLGHGKIDYHVLAKACGTDENGTSMQGIRDALAKYGHRSVGAELARRDFARLKTPALWLQGAHYLAVLSVDEREAEVYDPLTGRTTDVELPAVDDPAFLATVIALELPSMEDAS